MNAVGEDYGGLTWLQVCPATMIDHSDATIADDGFGRDEHRQVNQAAQGYSTGYARNRPRGSWRLDCPSRAGKSPQFTQLLSIN